MKLLLVEHYRPLTRALRTALEEEGHAVEVTCDLRRADDRAAAGEHDVILLDLVREQPDAVALLHRWRQVGLRTPILVLNGPDVRAGGPCQEADACLTLPFDFDALLAHLLWAAQDRRRQGLEHVAIPCRG